MTRRAVVRWALALAAALLLVGAGGWAWLELAPRRVPAGQSPLVHLEEQDLAAFRTAFNAHADETRLLVLLSPT